MCKRPILLAALMLLVTNTCHAGIQLLSNGGFETGTFASWTVTDQAGGSGSFFIDTPGTTTPLSGIGTSGVGSSGAFYAVSDQTGPGAHAITQSFVTPIGVTALTFSFDMFVNDSDGGPFVDPAGLDFTAFPNQHARVDILTAAAGALSTAAGDVVANFYLGVDPQVTNPNSFTSYSFDLLAAGLVGGTTYQVRFGEVDNQLFLNQGVDNVSIMADTGGNVVPEPASLAVWSCLGLVGLCATQRRKRKVA